MPTPLLRSSRRALAALFPLVLIAPLFAALDAPVSPNAQAGVWRTMHLLNRIEGKYILSGQQEMPAWDDTTTKSWDDDFAYIKAKTKKVPAVRGFDFLFYTHSAGGRTGQRSTERAIEWSQKGGVVAFAAHMFMLNGTNDGTNPHFYVPSANNGKGTLIDVRKVVVDGTPENKEFIEKLDLVAAELKKLQKANVPVIWRPFHESGGTWFWWSANGPEGFKAAWRFMFERYIKVHKLTNLIWCFNPADTAKLDAWYPGDDVVDMISLDVYPTAGTHLTFAEDYKKMRAYKDGRKVIAMSECGAIPDPAKMFTEGAGWSYFCTWNGFESDLTRHTVDFLKKVYTHKKVITLDELPAIRKANSLVIIDHPQPQIVVSGKKLTLSVKASGTGTLKYQWYRDGKKSPAPRRRPIRSRKPRSRTPAPTRSSSAPRSRSSRARTHPSSLAPPPPDAFRVSARSPRSAAAKRNFSAASRLAAAKRRNRSSCAVWDLRSPPPEPRACFPIPSSRSTERSKRPTTIGAATRPPLLRPSRRRSNPWGPPRSPKAARTPPSSPTSRKAATISISRA